MITKRETAIKAIENGKPRLNLWSDELLQDEELVLKAVATKNTDPADIHPTYNAEHRIPDDILVKAIELNGSAIYGLWNSTLERKALVTDELCRKAVRSNGTALTYVQAMIRTNKTQHEFLSKLSKKQLEDIDYKVDYPNLSKDFEVTEDMIRDAAASGCVYPRDIPREYRTEEVLIRASEQGLGVAYCIEEDEFTPKICKAIAKNRPEELKGIPTSALLRIFDMADNAYDMQH